MYNSKVFKKYIVDFDKNSEIFNSFFADKCVSPSQSMLLTENSLANCHSPNDQKLKLEKVSWHDMLKHTYIKTVMTRFANP